MKLAITVDITAVEFRHLNSFEWAVLELLNTFHENAPTIVDATAQLCLGEPAFLVAALENLRLAEAVRPKTDGPSRLDLGDYELSVIGRTILHEDGWEGANEETLSQDIRLEWPSLKFLSPRNGGRAGEGQQNGPSVDEVQGSLPLEKIEEWLNQNDNSRRWRVKNFEVTNVEHY